VGLINAQIRFIRALERAGKLNREVEFLPSDEELEARKAEGRGLTRPERAVLLAYSKITLYEALIHSDLPEDPYISTALERYFPAVLRERFRGQIWKHPLKREIGATHVTNSMVNRVGSTFVHRIQEQTGARPPEIVRAYLLTRETFDFVSLWKEIEALDNVVADQTQSDMIIHAGHLIVRGALWFLRNRRAPTSDLAAIISYFAPSVAQLRARLPELLAPEDSKSLSEATERWMAVGVPGELAMRVASLDALYSALDIVEVANEAKRSVEAVAAVYFALGGRLGLSWLHRQVAALASETHWQMLAKGALLDDLSGLQRSLAAAALKLRPELSATEALIHAWESQNSSALERSHAILADEQAAASADLSMLSVALRELRHLAHSGHGG